MVARLNRSYDAGAWFEPGVLVPRDWTDGLDEALDRWRMVQLFTTAAVRTFNGDDPMLWQSAGSVDPDGVPAMPVTHGMALAARRDFWTEGAGLYTDAVMGDAQRLVFDALRARIPTGPELLWPHTLSTYQVWKDKVIGRGFGCLEHQIEFQRLSRALPDHVDGYRQLAELWDYDPAQDLKHESGRLPSIRQPGPACWVHNYLTGETPLEKRVPYGYEVWQEREAEEGAGDGAVHDSCE
jgi:hypothetical protein